MSNVYIVNEEVRCARTEDGLECLINLDRIEDAKRVCKGCPDLACYLGDDLFE